MKTRVTLACESHRGSSPGRCIGKQVREELNAKWELPQLFFLIYNLLVLSFHSGCILMPSWWETEHRLILGQQWEGQPSMYK